MRDLFIALLAALLDGEKEHDDIPEWIKKHYPNVESSPTKLQFILDILSEVFVIEMLTELDTCTADVKISYRLVEWKSALSIDFSELTVATLLQRS